MNRTQRVLLIVAIAVAALAAGIGLYMLGRSTATPPAITPTPTRTAPTGPSSDPSPTYEPTDPNGSPEPAMPQGAAVAGEGGTKTGPGGLPLGYSHDETGAVNAATNYLIWMNSLKITDKKLADQMATASAADTQTRQNLIESFDLLRAGMNDLKVDEPQPPRGAYALANYSPNDALVYIWAPEVTTDQSGETLHIWSIDAVAVKWANGDWKLDRTAAVDPVDGNGNPTAEEKNSILSRTPADPGEITDSADQTWFEYRNAPH